MEIREEDLNYLRNYARIPIAFEVTSFLELSLRDGGLGGFELTERPQLPSFVKDYDALAGNHPTDWAQSFDLSNWGLLSVQLDQEYVAGAAVPFKTPGLSMLEGRSDLAAIWDFRVSPRARRMGIGSALLAAASRWATSRGGRQLKIETQNINVPACRFYASQGYVLGAIHRHAYPELPDEIQLLWYKDLV